MKFDRDIQNWIARQYPEKASDATPDTGVFSRNAKRIQNQLLSLARREQLKVLLFTHRPEYFDPAEWDNFESERICSITFCSREDTLFDLEPDFDVAVVCTHLANDHLVQSIIRARNLAPLLVSWTWDNHHLSFENLCNCALSDLVIPAHEFCADKLKTPHYILCQSIPLGTGQWSRKLASRLFDSSLQSPRSDALSGGYILWDGAERNAALMEIKRSVRGNELELIRERDRELYFHRTAQQRFSDWSAYKVSLQSSFAGDLSLRVFDALISGQIPIVPYDCHDLDRVIPPEIQEKLPIFRVPDLSPHSVEAAWTQALRRFDQMGSAGMVKRHTYALTNHHISHRLEQLISGLYELAEKFPVSVRINNSGIGLVQDVN